LEQNAGTTTDLRWKLLRPASGSGEDWNGEPPELPKDTVKRLRPASGSGEDWNAVTAPVIAPRPGRLRPASGSGEDWNPEEESVPMLLALDVASGLRVGRGLEQAGVQGYAGRTRLRPASGSGEDWNHYRPYHAREPRGELRPASGSGEDWNAWSFGGNRVRSRCARPPGRARIGTCAS